MGKECRVWVVFANERKCNHTRCLLTKGFVSWVDSYGFEVGDVVYLFMSNSRNIRFKTIVEYSLILAFVSVGIVWAAI